MLLFGDLRFVPNDPTTIGACFAQTEELITAILDRSISLLLLCLLLLRALFFCIKTAKTVLQKPFFSSKVLFVQKLLLRRIVVLFCVRDQKRKFVHVVSPPLRCSHASKISGTCCVFCAKIFRFLFLCIKLKLFSKEYSLIHAHAPYHKKETNIG